MNTANLVLALRRPYAKYTSKIPQNQLFNKFQNLPQSLQTTTPLTIPTNKTIPHCPTYFLFTLTISTSHTSNVLLLRIFDKFVIFTSKLWRLFQYLFFTLHIILCSFLQDCQPFSILNINHLIFTTPNLLLGTGLESALLFHLAACTLLRIETKLCFLYVPHKKLRHTSNLSRKSHCLFTHLYSRYARWLQ